MKRALLLTSVCLFVPVVPALHVAAQSMPGMSMPEPSPRQEAPPAKPLAARPKAGTNQPSARQPSAIQAEPSRQPVMRFGQVADGDTSTQARPVPSTPSPVTLGIAVQEQEHPAERTGSVETPMPALLADSAGRQPQALSFFADRARAANPTLREAEAQVTRLRAAARQEGLWQNPEIGYQADHVRGGSYHSGEQGGYVQQVIPLAGQRHVARAAVEAQAAAAEQVLEQQRVRVQSAVEQAFYAALTVQREVELRTRLAEVASETVVMTHQLANVGQADAPDMLQSEVEREQAKLDLATAQRAYRKAFAMLAAVSGDSTLPMTPLLGDLDAVPVLQGGAAVAAADASPMLHVAEQQVAASDAAIRSARRQQLPQLRLQAGLEQDNEPLESTGGRVGVVGVGQAGLTLPLWNRNQGAVAAAQAERAGAEAGVARTRLLLRMQAEQTWQDYGNAMQQAERYRTELLPRASRAYALYQQKYATMAAAYPQVLLSQRTLFQMQLEYVRTLGSAWQSAVLLQHGLLQDGLMAPEMVRAASGGTVRTTD